MYVFSKGLALHTKYIKVSTRTKQNLGWRGTECSKMYSELYASLADNFAIGGNCMRRSSNASKGQSLDIFCFSWFLTQVMQNTHHKYILFSANKNTANAVRQGAIWMSCCGFIVSTLRHRMCLQQQIFESVESKTFKLVDGLKANCLLLGLLQQFEMMNPWQLEWHTYCSTVRSFIYTVLEIFIEGWEAATVNDIRIMMMSFYYSSLFIISHH